ncbi:MAG: hypothetical protein SFU53_07380 [Terrimicrobiaceae bacterium]|nr:hypothetical protein [Terrimicrobiaceae bacterium]
MRKYSLFLSIVSIVYYLVKPVYADPIPDINDCGKMCNYKVVPYVKMASYLQSLGRDHALSMLKKWAQSGEHEEQVIVLCRMLFEARRGHAFRRPALGAPIFYGANSPTSSNSPNDFSKWPLEPIAFVDEVPFLVVKSYEVGGLPQEKASAYLSYCIRQTNWSGRQFSNIDLQRMKAALEKLFLLFSPPLSNPDRDDLRRQIQ